MISGDRSILAGKRGAFSVTLEGLSKEFERIDLIVPSAKPETRNSNGSRFEIRASPFPNVFFHPSSRRLWYQPFWILHKGKELIAQHHHDVCTVHEYPPFYNGLGAWLLSRATKIPYCIEIHHIVGWPVAADTTERIGRLLSRVILPWEAMHAKAVRIVNHTVGNVLHSWGVPHSRLRLFPSFYLDKHALTAVTHREKKYDIVFAGRMVSNKGVGSLLKALSTVPGTTCLFLGDGPERDRYQYEAKKLGIFDRMEFRGWQSDQRELWCAMTEGKVLVMPSKSEGGPRIALEAMALGLPVIATTVGVMPDIVKDRTNALFTSGSSIDLAEKISELLADAAWRERMGHAARSIVAHFDGEKLLHDYAQFLQSLA